MRTTDLQNHLQTYSEYRKCNEINRGEKEGRGDRQKETQERMEKDTETEAISIKEAAMKKDIFPQKISSQQR